MFGVCFASSKSKTLLQNWIDSKADLVIARDEMDEMNKLNKLGSCILLGCRVSDEASSRVQKARATSINWRHLWHWRDTC